MLYKEKILLLHRNSLLQERLATYLRENGFAVIMANNVDNTLGLILNMKPDMILWGESLTAHSKDILRQIKEDPIGKSIPIIALIPDLELFDRIEIEKSGINDILDAAPNFSELKVKIRFHLLNRKQLRSYERELRHLTDMTELQYNLIRVQDVNRLCELVNDYVFSTFKPETLISVLFNIKNTDFDFKGIYHADPPLNNAHDHVFELPIWKKYFQANIKMEPEQVVDNYLLEFFKTINLNSDVYYQFPLRAASHQLGYMIIGLSGSSGLPKKDFDELTVLAQSLAFRVFNNRRGLISPSREPEQTSQIQQFFKSLNENEISSYLSLQLLSHLKADSCVYFNYNEGFRFLYPQYCYKKGSDRNLFEDEKPPVLLLSEFPTFEKFMDSNKASEQFNLNKKPFADLDKLAALAGAHYKSLMIFTVRVGNELKGFFLVANEQTRKLFTNSEIQEAEKIIHKATRVLVESRVVKQAQQTIKQLDRVFELGKELTLEIEIDTLLEKIASSVRRTLGWNIVILDKKNLSTQKYQNVCVYGLKDEEYKNLRQKKLDRIFLHTRNNCFRVSQSYFCDHESLDEPVDSIAQRRFENSIGREWNDNDWLIVPIMSKGRELGFIAVNDPVERVRPNEEKVRSVEYFANQAAVALDNAVLFTHLKSSEEKYRLLAETMTMGLVTCDINGRIIYANNSLVKMLRYSSDQALLGHSLYDLCSIKTRGEVEKYVLSLVKSQQAEGKRDSSINDGAEIELLANDNRHIPFKLYISAHRDLLDEDTFIGVLADLRPQRKLERLKTDFNSMIVHDLRSPLNIIQGYIDIVRSQVVGQISEEQGDLLQIAKENVDKVLRLVDNFMIASKIEAGRFDMQMEINSINAVIEAVYEQSMVLARKKNIELSVYLDDNISLQQFDKMRIEQVLSNYLSNAIKFTPSNGTISIRSKLVKGTNELTGEETMSVHVSVKDTGVGIPPEEQSKVFNKYEQTEAGKDAALKGTGLGLAICKEIISMHNGEVWVESEPGQGSTFYFSLPITQISI